MKTIALVIAIVACGAISSRGDEPAQEFLDALRENGYHDIAIEYLTGLENGDLISDEFRRILPFEKAETLIEAVSKVGDYQLRESRLDEAQQLLTDYASQNKSLEVSARTLRFQGILLYQRASLYLKQSESDRLTAAEKEVFYEKSRTMLEASLAAFKQAKSQIARLVDPTSGDAILIDPADPTSRKRLQRFRKRYTDVTVQVPMVIEQLADTYEADDANRKTLLQDAVTEYKKIWDAYHQNPRGFPAGVQACIYAARCHQKLGQHQPALDLLAEVFDLGLLRATSSLSEKAFVLAANSWGHIDPYPHDEVIVRLGPIVKSLNRVEIREPNWLRIQLELAVAKHAKAIEIKKQPGARSSADANSMDREAAKVLRSVARAPSPYRDRARELLSEWNVSIAGVADANEKPPESFEDARQKGRDFVVELESLMSDAGSVRTRLRAATDVKQQIDIQAELTGLTTQIRQLADKSLSMFALSLELADESTPRRDINDVRFLQSFCYFASQQYFESAVIAEFLLAKYPTIDGTRPAMTLMIRSYDILLELAKKGEHEFERNQLMNACVAVVDRWPGSNEAGLAASTMTRLMLADHDYVAAEQYFLKIPANASFRGALGLQVGRQLWFDYRKRHREPNADLDGLADQLQNARQYLQLGVDEATLDTMNYDTALSALLLVDVYLEAGEVEEAVKRLETTAIAPLDLVKQKHPAVAQAGKSAVFNRATYKTAIKVYLAAMKESEDRQAWVDKANGVITAMRQEMESSQDPQDRARVTAIYQLIAMELESSFETITAPDERKKFAATLASFLGSIERDSNDAKTVLWAGATLLNLADSLNKGGSDVEAKLLFQQAVSALNRADAIGFSGARKSQMEGELQRQRALAHRGSGDFKAANEQFLQILTTSPSALNVQIDAAENLQMWAKATKRPRGYAEAIKGTSLKKDPKTGKNKKQIWGWEKIMMATRRNDKYRDAYYLSLARIIECRLEYGILENKPDAFVSAGKEIANERKRDPNFAGSESWKSKFDLLEKRVNAAKK